MTVTTPRQEESAEAPGSSELLIKEARRKARLRRLRLGSVLGVVVLLVLALFTATGGFDSTPATRNGKSPGTNAGTGHKSSHTAAAVIPLSAFYPNETLEFATPTEGWMIDQSSDRIMVTHDGGRTWSTSYKEPSSLLSEGGFNSNLDFVNIDDGWALVNSKGLVATTNAGRTWSFLPEPPQGPLMTFTFSSPDDGWALTEGALCSKHRTLRGRGNS